jgi:hypothetical protein
MRLQLFERNKYAARIFVYAYPGWTEEEIIYWTLPEVNEHSQIIRPARMSRRQLERYLAAESHNILTTAGRNLALQFFGNNNGTSPFAQYLAIGTFGINSVSPGDTSLGGGSELFRQVPNTTAITGTQNDIATVIGSSSGAGTWTNCGFYGVNATAVSGSGQLNSHALLSYTKVNGTPVTIDYIPSLT